MRQPPETPWTWSVEDLLQELGVSPDRGLNPGEVTRRRRRFGPNRLQEAKRKSAWRILADQFKGLMTALLTVAAALSFLFEDWVEGLAIAGVIVINSVIGFFTELRAVRSMEALHRMSRVTTRVRRQGRVREIPAVELVPGDLIVLEGGDLVPADLRLIEASKLQADESALTGESVPVSKKIEPIPADTPLAERKNMVFKGTALTRGSGEGLVAGTGLHTELGRISSLVEEAKEERTPLEKRLDQLGRRLIGVTLGVAALVIASGIATGKGIHLMVETGIALAVATVPEGLPIVATIALARGMLRMARRNALVNRLSAVETLGATNIICADKTGTLTENRMTVTQLQFAGETLEVRREGDPFRKNDHAVDLSEDSLLEEALKTGVLCNNATLDTGSPAEGENGVIGDPLEYALLVAGDRGGLRREALLETLPEVREEAFDPEVKMMATVHEDNGRYRVAVKGAPEAVFQHCDSVRTRDGDRPWKGEEQSQWQEYNRHMAEQGLRVLALATKKVKDPQAPPYEGLTLLGLVGLLDPPRGDVKEALASCQTAGIRVIMVTGDQPITAQKVAQSVQLVEREDEAAVIEGKDLRSPEGLADAERGRFLNASLFARVSPKQKLDLVTLHQNNGSIVAMTGDGVNDAPALKKADIGVAMGRRGTQVAREAADMVLKDDAFPTIVVAVEQGRIIFNNIRKFVLYLLSCNFAEVMVVGLASMVNAPLPILPLQILFLNLVTDVFPALALGVGEGDPGVMKNPPRDPTESILTWNHWKAIGLYGFFITFAVLGILAYALLGLELEENEAVTLSFLTLAFAQLWHVFNMRDRGSGWLRNDITRNRYVWGALVLCTGLLLAAVYWPGLAGLLDVEDPGPRGWALVGAVSLVPYLIGQALKGMRLFKI